MSALRYRCFALIWSNISWPEKSRRRLTFSLGTWPIKMFTYRPEPPADAYATHPSALSLNLFVLATAAVETNDSENDTGKAYEGITVSNDDQGLQKLTSLRMLSGP